MFADSLPRPCLAHTDFGFGLPSGQILLLPEVCWCIVAPAFMAHLLGRGMDHCASRAVVGI